MAVILYLLGAAASPFLPLSRSSKLGRNAATTDGRIFGAVTSMQTCFQLMVKYLDRQCVSFQIWLRCDQRKEKLEQFSRDKKIGNCKQEHKTMIEK